MKKINTAFFLLLLFNIVLFFSFASCKNPKGTQNSQNNGGKEFEVYLLSVWGKDALHRDAISLKGDEAIKTIEVGASNCQNFKLTYSIGDKSGSETSKDNIARVNAPEFPDGNNDLKITLEADGMKTFNKTLKIGIGLDKTRAKVQLKKSEDSPFIFVANGSDQLIKQDTAEVLITSEEEEMSKVLVNKVSVPLSEDKKSAKVSIKPGDVEINIEYAEYNEILFKFKIVKIKENEMLPIGLVKATLYNGDNYDQEKELEFSEINGQNENEMRNPVDLANIQYSVVKLVMEFDSPLKKAEFIRFRDGRSGEYASEPISSDKAGIFSGRIIKDIDASGTETNYENINGKIYTEYLVVGAGRVEYTIKFTAEGKKEQTYKVKINNTSEKVFSAGEKGEFKYQYYKNSITSYGLAAQDNLFRWVGYIPQPWSFVDPPYKDQKEWFKSMQQPEYMGDNVCMELYNNANIQGKLYFCYTVSENLVADKCHEWIRMEGTDSELEEDGITHKIKTISPCINPRESYVDAFIGVKDSLPLILMPVHTDKKWKKILDKGFILKIARSEEVTKMRRLPRKAKQKEGQLDEYPKAADMIFEEVFNYRIQAKTYEKNNEEGKEGQHPLVIPMKQIWVQNQDLQEVKFKPEAYLLTGDNSTPSKRDIFVMIPTFSGNMNDTVSSFKYKITKEGGNDPQDTKEYTYDDVSGMTAFVIGGDKTCTYTGRNGKTAPVVTGHDNIFKFEKGTDGSENVYEIAVEVELKNGKKEYFNFTIDYKNEHKLEQM